MVKHQIGYEGSMKIFTDIFFSIIFLAKTDVNL